MLQFSIRANPASRGCSSTLTAIMASLVIGLFQGTIEQVVMLAVLMPIAASMGGNAGTQTLTVAVRAIAMKELTPANALRVLSKEMLVGTFNGLLFAVIIGLIAWIWSGSIRNRGCYGGCNDHHADCCRVWQAP